MYKKYLREYITEKTIDILCQNISKIENGVISIYFNRKSTVIAYRSNFLVINITLGHKVTYCVKVYSNTDNNVLLKKERGVLYDYKNSKKCYINTEVMPQIEKIAAQYFKGGQNE